MHVERLRLRNFMSYVELDVRFPRCGVVLVSGANGVGKSALIEGIVWAIRGKPIRETGKGWHVLGKNGQTEVWIDGRVIKRGVGTVRAPTPAWVGASSVFVTGHIFSLQLLDAFSRASDADRLRLLEQAVGLAAMELAYQKAHLAYLEAQREVRTQEAVHARVCSGRDQTETRLGAIEPPQALAPLRTQVEAAQRALHEAKNYQAVRTSEYQSLHEKVQRYETLGYHEPFRATCPACGQQIPDAQRRLRARRTALYADLKARLHQSANALADATTAAQAVATRAREAENTLAVQERAAALHRQADELRQAAARDVSDAATALDQAQYQAFLAGLVDDIFAPMTIRRSLLTSVIHTLEDFTRQELRRMHAPFQVGFTLDERELRLRVDGCGGGVYAGLSTGQRRRADLALMLALGRVRAMAAGSTAIWEFFAFDECLDGVDADGREAIGERLAQLSENALVLVTSHEEVVRSVLPEPMHWRVRQRDSHSYLEVV